MTQTKKKEYYELFSNRFVRLGRESHSLGRPFIYYGIIKAVEDNDLLIEYKNRLISIPFDEIVSIEETVDKSKGKY